MYDRPCVSRPARKSRDVEDVHCVVFLIWLSRVQAGSHRRRWDWLASLLLSLPRRSHFASQRTFIRCTHSLGALSVLLFLNHVRQFFLLNLFALVALLRWCLRVHARGGAVDRRLRAFVLVEGCRACVVFFVGDGSNVHFTFWGVSDCDVTAVSSPQLLSIPLMLIMENVVFIDGGYNMNMTDDQCLTLTRKICLHYRWYSSQRVGMFSEWVAKIDIQRYSLPCLVFTGFSDVVL